MSRIATSLVREVVEVEKRRAFREADIDAVWDAQAGYCARCGKRMSNGFDADHILPRDLGGETTYANLQLVCKPCHLIKTAQDIKRITKARALRTKHADPSTRVVKRKRRIPSRPFQKKVKT